MSKVAPVSPGEMLDEEFLKPLGMTKYRLAKEIGVSGKRNITADTDLRLCRFFSLSNGWWLRLQAQYDTTMAKDGLAEVLKNIQPWEREAA